MKRIKLISTLIAILATSCSPAYSVALTGADFLNMNSALIRVMKSADSLDERDLLISTMQGGRFLGYIEGVSIIRGFIYCSPDHTTVSQEGDVIINYIKSHPQEERKPLDYLAMKALSQYYPCKK